MDCQAGFLTCFSNLPSPKPTWNPIMFLKDIGGGGFPCWFAGGYLDDFSERSQADMSAVLPWGLRFSGENPWKECLQEPANNHLESQATGGMLWMIIQAQTQTRARCFKAPAHVAPHTLYETQGSIGLTFAPKPCKLFQLSVDLNR